MISSHPKDHLLAEASEYGIAGYFAGFVGNAKDKTEEIVQVLLRWGFRPDSAVYLGDTINDVQAAKAAGVHSVGVATGYHIREKLENEDPDFVVDSLTDFTRLLRRS